MSVEASKLRGHNQAATVAGTSLSGGVTTTTTANTVLFSVLGLAFSKAAMAGVATPTTDAVTAAAFPALAASTGTVFVLCLDASGNLKTVQGTVQGLTSAGAFQTAPPQFPDIPDSLTPFAYVVVRNGASGTPWTYGSSNWNQAGITINVHDVFSLPKLPQLS